MSTRFVGWIRTHWRHWEPIVRGDDRADVWEELLKFPTTDEDGERIVLRRGERPLPLPYCVEEASDGSAPPADDGTVF